MAGCAAPHVPHTTAAGPNRRCLPARLSRLPACPANLSRLPACPANLSCLQAQYTRSSGASPDYLFLLQRLAMDNPDAAVNLAKMVAKQVGTGLGWVYDLIAAVCVHGWAGMWVDAMCANTRASSCAGQSLPTSLC